jgi:hypothetical protein
MHKTQQLRVAKTTSSTPWNADVQRTVLAPQQAFQLGYTQLLIYYLAATCTTVNHPLPLTQSTSRDFNSILFLISLLVLKLPALPFFHLPYLSSIFQLELSNRYKYHHEKRIKLSIKIT